MQPFIQENKGIIKLVLLFFAIFLAVSFLGKLKEYRFIGSGVDASNTITVTGEGKIDRAPDTAKVSFSVRGEAKELKTAQATVSEKIDAISSALKNLGIEENYIKTDSYNSYPKYEYQENTIRCITYPCPSNAKQIIVGYEVSHSITVSIKDLDKVNDVLDTLGTNGVTDMNGPNFGFEDDDAVAREARQLAIDDAKEEAKILAKQLGVHLVRIVSFNEGNGGYMPMYARAEAAGADALKSVALPVGDQTIQSNVTIVYEVR